MILLPDSLPAPPPEGHGSQLPLPVLLDAALFPMPALVIGLGLSTDQVRLGGFHQLRLLDDLPAKVQDDRVGQAEVAGDEALDTEGSERIEPDESQGQASHEKPKVGSIGVQRRNVVHELVGEPLSPASVPPADEGEDHHGVGGDETGGGEVDEPVEDFDGVVGRGEEGDAADQGDGGDAVDRDTGASTLEEELGRLAICNLLALQGFDRD